MIENQHDREMLLAAAESQPLGTCSLCDAQNVHVFTSTPLRPDTGDQPMNICVNCFIASDASRAVTHKPKRDLPGPVLFAMRYIRIFLPVTAILCCGVAVVVVVCDLLLGNLSMALLTAALAWGIIFITNQQVDIWRGNKRRDRDE